MTSPAMRPMKTAIDNHPLQRNRKPRPNVHKLGLLLLLFCLGFATSVVAGGDQIRDIRPGINTFADAIDGNPSLKYEIETVGSVNLVGTRYVTFSHQELVFKGLGITLVSQERKGEKWRLRKSKTQIIGVRIDKPAKVFERLQEMLPELSKIPFPDEKLKSVEKGLGKATRKTGRSLDYEGLRLRFFFFSSKDSKTMDRIRLLHWYSIGEYGE